MGALGIPPDISQSYQIRPGNLADGCLYVIGPKGDDNPGFILHDPVITNDNSTRDFLVGTSLAGVVGSGVRKTLVRAGWTIPFPGEFEQLVIYNVSGSGGNVAPDVLARTLGRGNSCHNVPQVPGQRLTPSGTTFDKTFRVTVTANATVTVTWTPAHDITLAAVRAWSKVPCTSAGGTYLFNAQASGGRRGTRALIAANYSLEGISAATLASPTMGTSTDLLVDAGELVTMTFVSNNADLVIGDLAVALEYTLR